jgi:hypothetical protein
VNTSNVVSKARVISESRKICEAEDYDFGGGTMPKWRSPTDFAHQVRIWEKEISQTKIDRSFSSLRYGMDRKRASTPVKS